jgi:hypothetical protein
VPETPRRAAVACDAAAFSSATFTRPWYRPASDMTMGSMFLQGPQPGLQMSSTTGSSDRRTSATKLSSSTWTGIALGAPAPNSRERKPITPPSCGP